MGIVTPGYAGGAAGQVLSGKLLRLAAAAPFRPSTGVQYVSGILYGPPGTMGELTLGSNTSLTINPFTAVVQNTLDATAGPFLITNDAAVTATTATVSPTPALPAQDASQFRRALIVTRKDDSQLSGVASSATTDRALLDIRAGALAASAGAAVLPAIGANELALGELLIPPTGQTVTLTPYNPRTTTRGGILPVIADGSTLPGHDGANGTHVDQFRAHPTLGLQRWNGTAWQSYGLGGDTGWVNYNSLLGGAVAGSTPPANAPTQNVYRVRNSQVTVLTNLSYNGAWVVDFAIANLPAICAPAYRFYFVGISYSGNTFNLYVDPGGVLRVANAITTNGLLASITYPTG